MRSLVKSFSDITIKSGNSLQPVLVDPSTYRDGPLMYFFGSDGTDYPFSFQNNNSSLTAYECCPPLFAIINRKAQAYINGKTWILNSKGKEATGTYANQLRNLFARPNPFQTFEQFEAQGYVYEQVFGFNVLLIIKPAGYTEAIDASHIWNIPPSMLDIKFKNKLFYQNDLSGIIESIEVIGENEERTKLNIDDVFLMKDTTPSLSNLVLTESRIKSHKQVISNIIGALDSRGELINYRGARGIFSNKASDVNGHVPLTKTEKDALQNDFRGYGLKKGQRQFIFTSANIDWVKIGQDVAELKLFEEIDDSTMMLCDGWNYPYRLMSSNKSTSLAGTDLKEFKKEVYEGAILPEAKSNYQQWNLLFDTAKYNLLIDKDYSHVPALQQDKKTAAEARKMQNDALEKEWRNGMLTLNMWLIKNGEDPIAGGGDDGRFDMYFPEYVAKFGDPMKGVSVNNNQNNNDGSQQNQGTGN